MRTIHAKVRNGTNHAFIQARLISFFAFLLLKALGIQRNWLYFRQMTVASNNWPENVLQNIFLRFHLLANENCSRSSAAILSNRLNWINRASIFTLET